MGELLPPTRPILAVSADPLRVLEPPAQDHVELESLPVTLKSTWSAKTAVLTKKTNAVRVEANNHLRIRLLWIRYYAGLPGPPRSVLLTSGVSPVRQPPGVVMKTCEASMYNPVDAA